MNWNKFDWHDDSTWPPDNAMVLWQAGDFHFYYFVGEFWIDDNKIPSIYTNYSKGTLNRLSPAASTVSHWTIITPAN